MLVKSIPKLYLLLVIVECYLLVTLLIYNLGPVQFRGHNTYLFIALISLYHIAFIMGYYVSAKLYRFNGIKVDMRFSSTFFYVVLFFALIGVLNTYKNLMLAPSFIPYNILDELARGVSESGLVYANRMEKMALGGEATSRWFNII